MWQVNFELQPLLRAAHKLVLDMLEWSWTNRSPGEDAKTLYLLAKSAPNELGQVSSRTDLYKHLALLACSPHLPAIREDYLRITSDYEGFLAECAPIKLDGPAKETAEVVFRYLYDNLLDSHWFWRFYEKELGPVFDKVAFRQRFGAHRMVCPICDYSKVAINSTTDHYLAQEHFPVLAVYWKNLIVACHECNSPSKGAKLIGTRTDGTKSFVPIFHPFFDNVAEHVRFSFGDGLIPQGPHPVDSQPMLRAKVENYRTLYDLERRYSAEHPEMRSLGDTFLRYVRYEYLARSVYEEPGPHLLRRVTVELAASEREDKQRQKGRLAKVKLHCDLLTFLEREISNQADRLALEWATRTTKS